MAGFETGRHQQWRVWLAAVCIRRRWWTLFRQIERTMTEEEWVELIVGDARWMRRRRI